MMREICDNIMDIAQNSISAGATLLRLSIEIDSPRDRISLTFDDNGKGMEESFLKTVADPFSTTRTTRKVGLGLPLLKQTAIMTGGDFAIESALGKGTKVSVSFGLSSIDRPPMGDVAGTIYLLVIMNPQMDFQIIYNVLGSGQEFMLDTEQIKELIEPLSIASPEISSWLRDYIKQEINVLHGGASFQ
ncbi:MAG: sensor histidine kinase [Christensenellales bacterium]|jgi:hypothetical protein